MATVKRCTKCREVKPVDQFPVRIDRGRRPRSHCTPCHNAAAKTPEAKALQRISRFRRKYGLTVEEYDQLIVDQGNECPICRTSFDDVEPQVDHCHTSGAVRGVLCGPCNKALGLLRDDVARLFRAADYLTATQEASTMGEKKTSGGRSGGKKPGAKPGTAAAKKGSAAGGRASSPKK